MPIALFAALAMPVLLRECLGGCCAAPGDYVKQSVSHRNRRGDTLLLVLCVGETSMTEDRSLSTRNGALSAGDHWKAATVGARTVGMSNQNLEQSSKASLWAFVVLLLLALHFLTVATGSRPRIASDTLEATPPKQAGLYRPAPLQRGLPPPPQSHPFAVSNASFRIFGNMSSTSGT